MPRVVLKGSIFFFLPPKGVARAVTLGYISYVISIRSCRSGRKLGGRKGESARAGELTASAGFWEKALLHHPVGEKAPQHRSESPSKRMGERTSEREKALGVGERSGELEKDDRRVRRKVAWRGEDSTHLLQPFDL
jgi:hypothetical protein